MKIRPLTPENHAKASALLRKAFPGSTYEVQLIENLRANGRTLHEWGCIHTNRLIAYIAFAAAYNGAAVCGLHLAGLAVTPEFQGQGVESELLRFALRQEVIRAESIFVLGDPGFYRHFGFEPCPNPLCALDKNSAYFLSLRNPPSTPFTVDYEPEFRLGRKPGSKPRRGF